MTNSAIPLRFPKKPDERVRDSEPVRLSPNGSSPYLISRNVTIFGHRTSVRLEPEMWNALIEIGWREGLTHHKIVERISEKLAPLQSLTSAIRVFIMVYYKASSTEEGHAKAGHHSGRIR